MNKIFPIFVLLLVIGSLAMTGYGLFLAFSASVIIGIAVFFLPPVPIIIGIAALCGHPELCHRIATLLGL